MRKLALVLTLLLTACASDGWRLPFPQTQVPAPADHQMLVAAANPLAAQAGMEVLRRGGTAARSEEHTSELQSH